MRHSALTRDVLGVAFPGAGLGAGMMRRPQAGRYSTSRNWSPWRSAMSLEQQVADGMAKELSLMCLETVPGR